MKSHFVNWREWELNPIVVKELRQAVRSWAVTGMLLVFLSVLFIASLIFLISQSFDVDANLGLGGDMFAVFAVILGIASLIFIPLYVGVRVAAERQENNPDLLYVSTLSPARIIRGKFFCGAYVTVLFFSACIPFMTFTNLLRGVDLPTVFSTLFYLFIVVCLLNMAAIFFACLPLSRPLKILFALFIFIASLWIIVPLIFFSFRVVGMGVGTMMVGRTFWLTTLTEVGLVAAAIGLFYFLSVALISPPSMNRALPVRLYLSVIWLLGGSLCFVWARVAGEVDRLLVWTVTTFVLMALSLLVIISNADQLSQRVRRTIPATPWKRPFAFLFFNGAAGGLIWVAVIVTVTFLSTYLVLAGNFPALGKSASSPTGNLNLLMQWAAALAYFFAYALTALFLQRKFFPKRPPKLAGLLAVLMAASWAILPSVCLFALNQLTWKSVEGLQLGNVFNVFSSMLEGNDVYLHIVFAFGWLVIALAINAPWFGRQMKSFRPWSETLPPPLLAQTPPLI